MFGKVAVLEISRNSLLTGTAGLQPTGCNATKHKLLTKFLKSLLKNLENNHEELCNGVPI